MVLTACGPVVRFLEMFVCKKIKISQVARDGYHGTLAVLLRVCCVVCVYCSVLGDSAARHVRLSESRIEI